MAKVTSFLACSKCGGTVYGAGETEEEATSQGEERFETHRKWHEANDSKVNLT